MVDEVIRQVQRKYKMCGSHVFKAVYRDCTHIYVSTPVRGYPRIHRTLGLTITCFYR